MKPFKRNLKFTLSALLTCVGLFSSEAATIGYGTIFGAFLDKDGGTLTAGGISVGFFTKELPTAAVIASLNNSSPITFSDFQSKFGYVDVRTMLDASSSAPTFVNAGDSWDFGAGFTGGTLTVPSTPSNAPATAFNSNDLNTTFVAGATSGTALWAIAYNAGNYSNGYSGSTQWAVVTATAPGATANDWIYPTSTENISLTQINASGEIVVGTDGASVTGGSVNNIYLVIPEPGTSALFSLGLLMSIAFKKKRAL